jgi:hyaluronoglucosaminidase
VSNKNKKILGIIEGFYGKSWSWSARQDYSSFLSEVGLGSYIYAPKSDKKLRSNWYELWSSEEISNIQNCSFNFKLSGLDFGIGFSPLSLVNEDLSSRNGKNLLEKLILKLDQISQIKPEIFCILFDDAVCSSEDTAKRQLLLCDLIFSKVDAKKIIICPSYYSSDPILEELFGAMPKNYWRDLGKGLDSKVNFFWTGEKVCSENFNEQNLNFIAEEFARLPVLWDNYPVNDGKKLSRFLRLKPFIRDEIITDMSAGHIANPMNQPYLSQLPLSTLSKLHIDSKGSDVKRTNDDKYILWRKFADSNLGKDLSMLFLNNIDNFSTKGLDGLTIDEKINLKNEFKSFDHPCVVELIDWFDEKYKFDPACLTS